MSPGLFLIAVPIGHVKDITLRALETLKTVDLILCEDTRVTARLCADLGIHTRLFAYHEHNAEAARPEIERRILRGDRVALVTDAGTPLISDPGFKLVQCLRQSGVEVTALPGPCAAINALVLSGIAPDRFYFEGFLPKKVAARKTRLQELSAVNGTLIFYESPNRVTEMLRDAAEVLGPRPVSVVREMTKKFEQVVQGRLGDDKFDESFKGEIVVLIGALEKKTDICDEEILQLLKVQIQTMSKKEAISSVSQEHGIVKKRVYQVSLKL